MNGSPAIPQGLRQQFDELEQRLWRFDAIVAISGGMGSLLLSYALIFISDRLWDTPSWMRVIFTGAGATAFGCFFYGYGCRWIWGARSFSILAGLVQKRFRRLGDRLLGIVELADEQKRPANFSPALCRAAIDQVAAEAGKIDFRRAVGTKRPRQYALGLLAAGAVAAAFCILAPQAGWNALLRWAWPAFNITRYTFVSLDNVPDHLVVAHGEPFELAVGLSAHSFLRPAEVSAQFENQSATPAPVRGGIAVFRLAGQTAPVVLTLRAGDVKRRIKIEPAFRPELKQLTAHIDLPAYLLYPPLDRKIESGALTFLKGSRITFKGQVTRALDRADVGTKERTPLRVEGDTFSMTPISPEGTMQLAFMWKDRLGLDAAAPAKVRLQPGEDAPPQVECRGLPATIAILEEEVVHIDIAAEDDFGIRDVGVRWQTASGQAGQLSEPVERKVGEGAPQAKTLTGRFDFSPTLLRIPADTGVAFYGTATDRFPGRPASLSAVHQIYVLSRESHARLIQERMEKLMAQLEELTRRQEALLDAGKNVRGQSPAKLADPATGKKLGDQASEQRDTAEELERIAKQTAETLREALRNKDLKPSTLQDWGRHAQAMEELAQQNMPAAAQSLGAAQTDDGSRAPKLDHALGQEEDILKKLREMQNATELSLEKLMTQSIALRLRKIARSEKNIGDDFQKILPEVIGMKAGQLPDVPRQTVEAMTALQRTASEESNKLHGEIARFFERTRLERYGDVSQGMETTDADESLVKLAQVIEKNISVQAMQSTAAWSSQFELWADRLSGKDDSKSADSSKGGESGAAMKALMALLRLRQQEDVLREQTGALDRQKNSNPRYGEDAHAAAARQKEVRQGVEQLQEDADFPIPSEQLAPIGKAMQDAGTLLDKPDTGDPAIAAETDAINMLDAILLAQSGKSGKSMASLMQMMGFGAGALGGGSMAGGGTDRANIPIAGSRAGTAPEGRHVVQAGGGTGSQIPAEFREAIESYQHAIEQEGATP